MTPCFRRPSHTTKWKIPTTVNRYEKDLHKRVFIDPASHSLNLDGNPGLRGLSGFERDSGIKHGTQPYASTPFRIRTAKKI